MKTINTVILRCSTTLLLLLYPIFESRGGGEAVFSALPQSSNAPADNPSSPEKTALTQERGDLTKRLARLERTADAGIGAARENVIRNLK